MRLLSFLSTPFSRWEWLGATAILLFVYVLPTINIYWVPSTEDLKKYEISGPIEFRGQAKRGSWIVIGNQFFTCSPTGIYDHECGYFPVAGQLAEGTVQGRRDKLEGREAHIVYTKLWIFPGETQNVILELSVEGVRYRKPEDFEAFVAFAKYQRARGALQMLLLYFFYIWVRLRYRPDPPL